jgi:TolB protein
MTRMFLLVVLAGCGAVALTARSAPEGMYSGALAEGQQQQQPILDEILTSRARNPRLGIPAFFGGAGDAALTEALKTVADVLAADLAFEQEFYVIDRQKTAALPSAADPASIDLGPWRDIGADFIVHGVAQPSGQQFTLDLRMIRVTGEGAGTSKDSQRYGGCSVASARACAHYIADDLHKRIRQLDGVAQTRLAFVSDRDGVRVAGRPTSDPGSAKEIYISDYDGHNVRRVTANRSLALGPAWSPDGASLAYTMWPPGAPPNVFVNTLDGRPGRALVNDGGDVHASLPAWSPDGQRIAFVSTRAGSSDIWVANRDGSGLRNLTAGSRAIDNAPTWSPDGTKIAFTSDRAGGNKLYIMDAETGLGLQIITTGETIDRPTWSAQGQIAYTSGSGWQHSISVYDFTTDQASVLTDGRGDNQGPAFSPTGRHIAFMTTRWGREEIAIMNRKGENVLRITNLGNNKSPSWSRARAR